MTITRPHPPILPTCAILVALAAACGLPAATVGESLGVNTHFLEPVRGEMDELAASGVGWMRVDLTWKDTETAPGRYDFSSLAHVRAEAAKRHLRIVQTLDYANPLYDGGLPPRSPKAIAAYAAWAAAAVAAYPGHDVLWEIWNEPNEPNFWPPAGDATAYAALATAATAAIHAVAPHEQVVGPALSKIDSDYLEEVFRSGVLAHWSAVTVHPYRDEAAPETVADDLRGVRALIRQWAPPGAEVPVMSGEWGYSSVWKGYDQARQARCLARMLLTNLGAGVPLSIWYDWRDDSSSPTDAESNFGLVRWQEDPAAAQPFVPKPAYRALATLTRELGACTFSKRFATAPDDHLLLFTDGAVARLAVWSGRATPHGIRIPMGAGPVRVVDLLGAETTLTSSADGLALTIDESVRYLSPPPGDELLAIAAAWQAVPQEWALPGGAPGTVGLRLRNPLGRAIRIAPGPGTAGGLVPPGGELAWQVTVSPSLSGAPSACDFRCAVEGLGSIEQHGVVVAANPLTAIGALTADGVAVRLDAGGAQGFAGTLSGQPGTTTPIAIAPGVRSVETVVAPLASGPWTATVTGAGGAALVRHLELLPLAAERWLAAPDGDGANAGSAVLQPATGPLPTVPALGIAWKKPEGWRFFRVAPAQGPITLAGRPEALTMWIRCHEPQPSLCLRFQDATGQMFQPGQRTVAGDPAGWHRVAFRLTGRSTYHWGGANDGIVHAPIQRDTLLSVDPGRGASSGTVELQAPLVTW